MNYILSIIFFLQRKILPGFYVKKGDLVIDIGSGDKPFWRADVFFDNLSLANNQRISHLPTVHDVGLFFDGNVEAMPFKDKAFDFSFCSHLLEHVQNPAAALQEIMRISKRGYIEVPSAAIESLSPFESHLWYIYHVNHRLVFVRKSKLMHDMQTLQVKTYGYLVKKVKRPFIRLYWNDSIDYNIINDVPTGQAFVPFEKNGVVGGKNWYLACIKIFRKIYYKQKSISKSQLLKDTI